MFDFHDNDHENLSTENIWWYEIIDIKSETSTDFSNICCNDGASVNMHNNERIS